MTSRKKTTYKLLGKYKDSKGKKYGIGDIILLTEEEAKKSIFLNNIVAVETKQAKSVKKEKSVATEAVATEAVETEEAVEK